jgi:hypothetical protein
MRVCAQIRPKHMRKKRSKMRLGNANTDANHSNQMSRWLQAGTAAHADAPSGRALVWMPVRARVCVSVSVAVCDCMAVSVRDGVHVCVCAHARAHTIRVHACTQYACMYVCMYVCMCMPKVCACTMCGPLPRIGPRECRRNTGKQGRRRRTGIRGW